MEAPIGCKVGRNGRIEPPRRSRGARSAAGRDFGRVALKSAAGSHDDITPGAVATELKTGASDAAGRTFVDDFYKLAIPADLIARAIRFAIEQPADVDVNQIVVRPTVQEF